MLALLSAASCGDGGAGADAGTPAVDARSEPCEAYKLSDDIRVTDAPGSSLSPALAWSGTALGLTWYDERDGNAVFFAALGADGEKLTEDLRLSQALTIVESPAITAAEGGFGLAWQQFTDGNNEIYFTLVPESGEAAGAAKRVTVTGESSARPAIARVGGELAVAWVEAYESGANEEICAARLTADGDRIGGIVRITDDPSTSYAPSVAGGDPEYAIAWHDWRTGSGDLYLARMDATGQQIGADNRLTVDAADSFVPRLARGGDGDYGLVWHDNRGSVWDVYFARVDPSGILVGLETRVSEGNLDSTFAAIAFTGNEYGIAWQEEVDANRQRILFARYSASGERRGEAVVVSEGPAMSSQPTLAWTGSGFAVAWQDNRDGNYEIYLALLGCH